MTTAYATTAVGQQAAHGRSVATSARGPSRVVRRLAIIVPHAGDLVSKHRALLASLLGNRQHILCLAPDFPQPILEELAGLDVDCETFPQGGEGLHLRNEFRTIRGVETVLKDWRPHGVLCSGGPLVLYALIAARLAKIEHKVGLLDEVASLLPLPLPAGAPSRRKPVRSARSTRLLRRAGLRLADALIVHNNNMARLLEGSRLIRSDQPVYAVRGFGADLDRVTVKPLPGLENGLTFAMIAPMSRNHGVLDFFHAARLVHQKGANARFLFYVMETPGQSELTNEELAAAGVGYNGSTWHASEGLRIQSAPADVLPAIARTHVVVQPSHLGDGLPQILIEALAAGRPVITGNVAGCREVVDERVNGCLVPPANAEALADAMCSFLRRPDLIAAMARASRAKAERLFDAGTVNRQIMDILRVG